MSAARLRAHSQAQTHALPQDRGGCRLSLLQPINGGVRLRERESPHLSPPVSAATAQTVLRCGEEAERGPGAAGHTQNAIQGASSPQELGAFTYPAGEGRDRAGYSAPVSHPQRSPRALVMMRHCVTRHCEPIACLPDVFLIMALCLFVLIVSLLFCCGITEITICDSAPRSSRRTSRRRATSVETRGRQQGSRPRPTTSQYQNPMRCS